MRLLTKKQVRLYNNLAIRGKKRLKKKAIKKLDDHNFITKLETSTESLEKLLSKIAEIIRKYSM